MRKSGCTLWLNRFAWGIVLVDLMLILLVPAELSFGNMALLIAYAIWLILSPIVASTWLVVHYRSFFRKWLGWILSIIVLLFSNLVFQDIIPIQQPNIDLFFTLLFSVSCWIFGIATIVLLWYRDIGLGLIAWGSVIMVWILLFAWRFQGDLIELSIYNLAHLDEPAPLGWAYPFICIFGWIVPLGIFSFLGHTVCLIVHELK